MDILSHPLSVWVTGHHFVHNRPMQRYPSAFQDHDLNTVSVLQPPRCSPACTLRMSPDLLSLNLAFSLSSASNMESTSCSQVPTGSLSVSPLVLQAPQPTLTTDASFPGSLSSLLVPHTELKQVPVLNTASVADHAAPSPAAGAHTRGQEPVWGQPSYSSCLIFPETLPASFSLKTPPLNSSYRFLYTSLVFFGLKMNQNQQSLCPHTNCLPSCSQNLLQPK